MVLSYSNGHKPNAYLYSFVGERLILSGLAFLMSRKDTFSLQFLRLDRISLQQSIAYLLSFASLVDRFNLEGSFLTNLLPILFKLLGTSYSRSQKSFSKRLAQAGLTFRPVAFTNCESLVLFRCSLSESPPINYDSFIILSLIMSFFNRGDFKTRQQWLKRQKKAALKKEEEKFNKNLASSLPHNPKKEKLNQIVTLDTEQSHLSKPSTPHTTRKQFKNEADAQLYHSMETRLKEQQEIKRQQQKQITEINRLIQQIKTENAILKGVNSQIPSFDEKERTLLANKQLKKQCMEMQAYLNAHGSFYEGSTIVGTFNIDKIKKDIKQAKTNYRTPTSFEFSAIAQRVHQLNENLMKELGTKKIVNAQGVAKFIQSEVIKLSFFKDAVSFQGVGNYEYSTKDGMRILGDLMDGYYPHILKTKYPQGVYFNIENRLGEELLEQKVKVQSKDWFFGEAHSL